MAARNSDDRQFTEDLECLLRGEEAKSSGANSEYTDTLAFARKLIALREEPRAEFASRLRQRLMVEMAEQDQARQPADSRSWIARLFGQPGLRLAMVSTFVVLAATGLLWRAGLFSMLPEQPAASTPGALSDSGLTAPSAPEASLPDTLMATQGEPAAVAATREATPYTVSGYVVPTNAYGETVTVSLLFQNRGAEGVTLSPFPPEVSIRNASTGQTVHRFVAGESQLALSSMESAHYDISWDQKDTDGNQVVPGTYEVELQAIESVSEKGAPAGSSEVRAVASFEVLPQSEVDTVEGTNAQDN